jgi:cyclase
VGAGDPDGLCEILERVSDLSPEVLVPGHGPVGGSNSLEVMRDYIRSLDGLARRMVEDGEAEETIDEMAVPEQWEDWLFAAFFPLNLHFLYQLRSG